MNYRNVIVIGFGSVAAHAIKELYKYKNSFNYELYYVEHEDVPLNVAVNVADSLNINRKRLISDNEVQNFLMDICCEATLVVSATNNYIFKSDIIRKPNVDIINFHNALLPNLPGRNAASWAIFEEYKETGITWHFVNEEIDAGNIISQKKIGVEKDIRAYELAKKLMDLANDSFDTFIIDILQGNLCYNDVKKQITDERRKIYKSTEVPNDGIFNVTDDTKLIYRTLRAMDYGKNSIFPMPKLILDGQEYIVKRYKKIEKNTLYSGEYVRLNLDADYDLILKY